MAHLVMLALIIQISTSLTVKRSCKSFWDFKVEKMGSSGDLKRSIFAALLGFLLFHGFGLSEKAPYSTFARDARSAPLVSYYDYIIIGGGTSGCALAATLSQRAAVLLLERGDLPYSHLTINNIGTFAATLADTSPTSPSQAFISTDGVINSRARVLGGGSALNAGFYSRASGAYVGKVGWDPRLVNASYEWVERKVVFRPPMLEWQTAVRDGLVEVGVLPYNGFTYEHVYGTKVGGTIFDHDGRRHTAADLLEYADPRGVTVLLNATVHQIFFKTQGQPRPRAHGVEFRDQEGIIHRAYLNMGPMNEVILAAGALGSPQMLMLSGIGPKAHLMAHGIEVLVDQPMVGQGMSDNPMNAILIPSPRPVEVSLIQVVGITRFDSYIEAASGSQFSYVGSQRLAANFEMLANQTGLNNTVLPSEINPLLNPTSQAGVILEKIMGPLSTGHLELLTRDPYDNPRVTFNYFKDPRDLQKCVQGMRTIIQVIESRSFSRFRYRTLPVQTLISMMLTLPMNTRRRHVSAAFSLEQFCIDTVMTIWHYHGGCQVGRVVDQDYKVLGVDALRVIDGSTFDGSPGTNPQATVMMLGRYMGQRILHERFPNGMK
ncbi:protein HOTHEAD-like isoform X2 [Actinidia eriantha]|uniref:protein HOTHEAD-like isoform X2 n=1 Tax=Actinidia eriantha TaxID=165200 RepID=UPI0025877581|nr:protein HOTHEAD-like isoform X2 [Actinidia eriantha]XP_057475629.1 protein HOTHEAD-like isoform X2 [Actinidia eriantha]